MRAVGRGASAGGIDATEVLGTARSLLAALAYVHQAGIVHGDLKPGNVLLRRPGEAVLVDFGVAQFADGPLHDDRPAGTPLYLAPEQFRGAGPSTSTDLFAVGAILWELVEGRPARRHSDLLSTHQVAFPPVNTERLAALGPSGPRLAEVIDGLMARDPAARPSSAEALAGLSTGPSP
jgi:serine/threonine protein kinase